MPDDQCTCRKPEPGLFHQIAERFGQVLAGVPAAGDSVTDAMAAAAVGCEPHLLLTGNSAGFRQTGLPDNLPPGTFVHQDMESFAEFILARQFNR